MTPTEIAKLSGSALKLKAWLSNLNSLSKSINI